MEYGAGGRAFTSREGWEWFSGEPHKLLKRVRLPPPQLCFNKNPADTAGFLFLLLIFKNVALIISAHSPLNMGTIMAEPKPFHEVIVRKVKGINVENILDTERTKLSTLADIAASCDLPGCHDEMHEAFVWAYRFLMHTTPPKYLLSHIAAEKVRKAEHDQRCAEAIHRLT